MRQKSLSGMAGILLMLFSNATAIAQSPYELHWPKDGIIFATGLVSGAIGGALVLKVDPFTPEEINTLSRDDVNAFDRPATYNYSESANINSDIVVIMCSALPLTLFLSKDVRKDFSTFGAMYLQMLIFSSALPPVSKGAFQRTRPFVYNENAPIEKKTITEARLSFFSGHTTHAFAGAVFFSVTYGAYFPDSKLKPFVWGGSLLLASAVGYLRIEAGKHFRTDVLVGAAIGSAIGYFIPRLHQRSNDSGISLFPLYRKGALQAGLSYSF